MLTRRLEITGVVQGVGFRYSMQREALRLSVRGWVRNRRDGSVEALAHGEPAAVERLIEWARRGPPGAKVVEVRSSHAADEPATAFEIRSTG
jgi:acylphosphatase